MVAAKRAVDSGLTAKSGTRATEGQEGERSEPGGTAVERVPAAAALDATRRRRTFSASYKLRILREADRVAGTTGGVGSLLRREGLYASHLTFWRKAEAAGELAAAGAPAQGRPSKDGKSVRERQLERELERTRERLRQTELIVEVQKKLSMLLEGLHPTASSGSSPSSNSSKP